MKDPIEMKECSLLVLTYNLKEQCGPLKSAINKIYPMQFILSKKHAPTAQEKFDVQRQARVLLEIAQMIVDGADKL